jgi:hypothetical protein
VSFSIERFPGYKTDDQPKRPQHYKQQKEYNGKFTMHFRRLREQDSHTDKNTEQQPENSTSEVAFTHFGYPKDDICMSNTSVPMFQSKARKRLSYMQRTARAGQEQSVPARDLRMALPLFGSQIRMLASKRGNKTAFQNPNICGIHRDDYICILGEVLHFRETLPCRQ